MALSLTKATLGHSRLIAHGGSLVVLRLVSGIQDVALRSIYDRELILGNNFVKPRVSGVCHNAYQNCPSLFRFFASFPKRLRCEGPSSADLLRKLENAVKDHQVDVAWETFNEYKNLYGLPEGSLVSRLITELAYSSNSHWLTKAWNLVLLLQQGKSNLLHSDSVTKLSLSLARAQMPVPASMILRLMLEKESAPPMDILCSIIMHMVKTEIGTYLASNILVEICDCFQPIRANKFNCARLTKPDTMIFNLVLDACVRFGSSFKGQQLIELMPQVGVLADAHSIVIIAQIHEINCQRDELKKFKVHIDQVLFQLLRHYRQFYDSLLSLHFKFNDIEAASELVLEMYRCRHSLCVQTDRRGPQKPCFVSIGPDNLKTGLKIQIMPGLLQKDSVLDMSSKHGLINNRNGKLVLSKRGLARLISSYKRGGKLNALSKLLISIEQEFDSQEETSLCYDVIDACIHLGWLETAHDILEDMELAGLFMGLSAYMSLLTAYNKRKMFREANALLNHLRKVGLITNVSDEMLVSAHSLEVVDKSTLSMKVSTSIEKSELAKSLVLVMKEEEKAIPPVVYELNSSIYFFCKAKMIEDALKTYRRMQGVKIQPTVQTFANLVQGHSSLEMYREITILWGDIKRNMESQSLLVNRDLFEFLLLNFLRGGYFERVMEVIGYMKDKSFFTDKRMYRSEFLKFHKDLYKNLIAAEARTEAQSNRLEFVRAFRKWVGID